MPAEAPVLPFGSPFPAPQAAPPAATAESVEGNAELATRGPGAVRREPSRDTGRTSLPLREKCSLAPLGSAISV